MDTVSTLRTSAGKISAINKKITDTKEEGTVEAGVVLDEESSTVGPWIKISMNSEIFDFTTTTFPHDAILPPIRMNNYQEYRTYSAAIYNKIKHAHIFVREVNMAGMGPDLVEDLWGGLIFEQNLRRYRKIKLQTES